MNTLNLGAGNRIVNGAVNHDLYKHREEIDIAHDLNDLPWPWKDKSFDKIVAWAVFEHLKIDLITAMNECWRILRPDGKLRIKLPWCMAEASFNDPTHRYTVGRDVFNIFDRATRKGKLFGSFYLDELGRPVSSWKIEVSHISRNGNNVVATLLKEGKNAK